jgi:hypothetical protein
MTDGKIFYRNIVNSLNGEVLPCHNRLFKVDQVPPVFRYDLDPQFAVSIILYASVTGVQIQDSNGNILSLGADHNAEEAVAT